MTHEDETCQGVWSDADFDKMSWHDVYVHGMAFDPDLKEFIMDIDYIHKWIPPEIPADTYSFAIVPSTLVFHCARNIEFEDLEIGKHFPLGLEIGSIEKDDPVRFDSGLTHAEDWRWTMDCQEGVVSVRSTGFTQYARCAPVISGKRRLTLDQRGGISFYKSTFKV